MAWLLGPAAAGWAAVLWQAAAPGGGSAAMEMGAGYGGIDLTMGMTAPLFLAMWVAMMVGMMFPASVPMILAFARSQSRIGPRPELFCRRPRQTSSPRSAV